EKFPMTLNRNRKALAIVHEDVLNNSQYVLSFDGNPANDIAQLLGGSTYGLHILPEWEQTVLDELIRCQHLKEHDLYFDQDLFPECLHLFSIDLTEPQADQFIERLIQEGQLTFPKSGTGKAIMETNALPDYLIDNNEPMADKVSDIVTIGHNPLEDEPFEHFASYPRELFPVQAHSATAVAKRLKTQNAVIIQGEMSTGKSAMMTAIADGYHAQKGQAGYHVCLMCPPSLTKKWPLEIKEILPHAVVHVIEKTEQLIAYHSAWMRNGKPKPKVPTFFVISFTTMRGDARTVPAVSYELKQTTIQKVNQLPAYRDGLYCSCCGKPHQTVENITTEIDVDGNEQEIFETVNMSQADFGDSRRLHNGVKPANAFCYHCKTSLWTKKIMTRYEKFSDWAKHEENVLHAIHQENPRLLEHVQMNQPDFPKATGMPRRVAAIEYIRRKMNCFFDISLVDEVHELKGGMTAQGNSLGALAQVSKKVVAGTGTLFGGKAEDVYYLLWRLFPHDMVKSGFQYKEVTRFNEEYGNIEETVVERKDGGSGEYTNTNSRGGERRSTKKVLPGISPFIYGRYMIQNIINVRLKDVWPDPVELVDTPTIFVEPSPELDSHYRGMISAFEHCIDTWDDGFKLYMQMTDYGIAYADNPFSFPSATFLTSDGNRDLVWEATHLSEDCTLPKEAKLQEIITSEMSEGRKSIVYVRDTGSSVEERDVRPRLKQKLEEIGAKVCILDVGTTKTNLRSDWLKVKMEQEGYDVCIVSQELVKVGLDLLCTPTLIYYQFSWSLFTINQSARRSWRIGQNQECRLFYLAYKDTFQEKMAQLIALKNRATSAINGEVTSDGLSAMLGDEGDLQSMLIQSVKKGGSVLKGSAEEWIHQTSDRARELLANIGKKHLKPSLLTQFQQWVDVEITGETTKQAILAKKEELVENIRQGLLPGFVWSNDVFEVDLLLAFGFDRQFVADGAILYYLTKPQRMVAPEEVEVSVTSNVQATAKIVSISDIAEKATEKKSKSKKRAVTSDSQLTFDLFG
ncbi:MAG: DEAD/DEAH box helicase, partial [Paenisporosarcina sp.]|nr:DEAD/DEAH box helicase [Paenisporosarcina sp.]